MCQMAFKEISPDVIGQWVADFSSSKIRIDFEVDSFQHLCLKIYIFDSGRMITLLAEMIT